MAIRLNLLAEVQAAEDMRRRDPVKRAIWVGGLLVTGMLVWSLRVGVSTMIASRELSHVQGQIAACTNDFRTVQENKKKADDVKFKLGKLHQLASERFLNGNLLNALQQTIVDDVYLARLAVKQEYVLTEETKAKTNSDGVVLTKAKPATVRESIIVTLEARDTSKGNQVTKFKEALATNTYFAAMLGKTNEPRLANLGPTPTPGSGEAYQAFTVECKYPDRTR
jgi:hypothetical protein